jgi:hypothetical protein
MSIPGKAYKSEKRNSSVWTQGIPLDVALECQGLATYPGENAPNKIAPTKMIAAQTASTFSFNARSTLQASLNVDTAKV